jgi:GNAT superfamily N-acetyltransferase
MSSMAAGDGVDRIAKGRQLEASDRLAIQPLSPETWSMLEDLFGSAGASHGCWCMYPRIGPEYGRRPREANKCDRRELAEASPSPGLLLVDGEVAVGWCEVAPRADLAWLDSRPMFRTDSDGDLWAIGCFYIRRSRRQQGLMGVLIDAAVEYAAAAGAAMIEAYPVDTNVAGHTRSIFSGVASTFADHGFEVVARSKKDRPIMRRWLRDR